MLVSCVATLTAESTVDCIERLAADIRSFFKNYRQAHDDKCPLLSVIITCLFGD